MRKRHQAELLLLALRSPHFVAVLKPLSSLHSFALLYLAAPGRDAAFLPLQESSDAHADVHSIYVRAI